MELTLRNYRNEPIITLKVGHVYVFCAEKCKHNLPITQDIDYKVSSMFYAHVSEHGYEIKVSEEMIKNPHSYVSTIKAIQMYCKLKMEESSEAIFERLAQECYKELDI